RFAHRADLTDIGADVDRPGRRCLITGQPGGRHPVAGIGERRSEVPPGVRGVREPVHSNRQRPAGVGDVPERQRQVDCHRKLLWIYIRRTYVRPLLFTFGTSYVNVCPWLDCLWANATWPPPAPSSVSGSSISSAGRSTSVNCGTQIAPPGGPASACCSALTTT